MASQLTKEQLLLLQKPLPTAAISPHPTKANMSSIRPIFVVERLNDVFGVGQWALKTDLLPINGNGDTILTLQKITKGNKERTEYSCIVKTVLSIPAYDIYYECIAGSTNDDMGDAAKGGTSDGLTKICSWLGIGMAVYKGEQDKANQQWLNLIKPDVKEAIRDLLDCHSIQEMISLKDQLYTFIVEQPEFIAAAKERHAQIKALETAEPSQSAEQKRLPAPSAQNVSPPDEKTSQPHEPTQPDPLKPVAPGSLGVNILDAKGNLINVGQFIIDANDREKVNGTLRWLRIKEKDGYSVTAWMNAIHEKAINQLGLLPVTDPETKLISYADKSAQPA